MKKIGVWAAAGLLLLAITATSTIALAQEEKKDAPKEAPKVVAPTNEIVERGWDLRCPDEKTEKQDKKQCEVFQRLDVKGSEMRVAELAIGFPKEGKGIEKGGALGAVVLPLGILLDESITLKIDEEKPFSFRTRYCTAAGCVSYVNMSKSMLDTLRAGKQVTFNFKTADGQNVNIVMNLGGLDKILKDMQQ